MQYKGFKRMKCIAAIILSAAIVLTDVSGVSAAEYGQTLETEAQEETTQSLAEEDTVAEDAAVESETLQETVEISDEIAETQPEIIHTEENTEIDTDAGSAASDFSGETEPAETREETSSAEMTETTEVTDPEAEGMEIKAAVEDFRLNRTGVTLIVNETFDLKKQVLFTPENAESRALVFGSDNTSVATVSEAGIISAVGVGDATITIRLADDSLDKKLTFAVKVSDEANIIRFKLYDDASDAEITKTTISVGEPVVIQAVFGAQTPFDASLQWSSSNPAYVKTTQRTNLINTSAVELEGLKPTPTNESVVITCILTYPDKTQFMGMLDVTVKPLAESVTISLGREDATGKEVIYDLVEKQFIAVGTTKLPEPVSELSASIFPKDADQRIRWSSSDNAVIKFDDEESGKAVGNKNGEATVTAAPYVLHGKGADGKEVKGTVRVKTRRIIKSLSFTPKTSDKNEATRDSYGRIEIAEGMKITLEPTYMPNDATVKKLKWSNGDKNALDISVNESTNIATVTAKKVAKNTVVKLIADATDMGGASCELEFIVKPKVEKIYIYRKGNENTCLSGGTVGVEQSETFDLIARNEPGDAMQRVTWKISNTKIADLTSNDDGSCTITVKDKGTAQITATAADGSKVTAVTTLNVSSLAQSVTIEGSDKVMVGGKIKLTASVSPKSASNKNIKWESLTPKYATVNEKTGVVTGLATDSNNLVTTAVIRATVQDGSGISKTHNVFVYAAPEKFDIMIPDSDKDEKNDVVLTGKTIGIDPDMGKKTYEVAARILPQKACQEVEWKSSNEKVATVDKNGVITAHDVFGKAIITASAIDGSNRKASITVNVATLVTNIKITGGHYVGYSDDEDITLQLKAVVGDKDATNKSVVWKSEYPGIAEVDETGLVTANAKTGSTEITAEAVDGSGIIAKHMVYVVSSKNKVTINEAGSSIGKWVIDSKGGKSIEEIDLAGEEEVSIYLKADLSGGSPERDGVPMEIKWSTSDKNVATVEVDKTDSHKCTVTLHNKWVSGKKTVKITATTTEGYAASGSVTIKDIENTNPYVTITGPGHRLANGKKMQLSAGSIAVEWYSDNEALAKVDETKGVVTATSDKSKTGTVRITAVPVVYTGVPHHDTYEIDVKNPTSKVDITLNGNANIVTNKKVGVDIIKGYDNQSVKLGALLDDVPSEEVTWKSSNKAIAAIDEDGNLDIKKTGNVTLTATAIDGSRKSGKVTLVVTKQVTGMEPAGGKDNIVVGLKKSVQLSVTYKPLGTTIKKATWSSSDPNVVSVNKNNGRITGKDIGTAVITATATDGSGVSCEFTVSVEPAVSKVEIVSTRLGEYSNVVGVDLSSGDTDTLSVNLYTKEGKEFIPIADQDVTWSSGNKAIAEVDKDGKVTVHKAGTVTIKATATDGSRKSGTIKLYAGQLVKSIDVNPSVPATIKLYLRDKTRKTYDLSDKISVSPVTASNKTLVFTSSDKKYVTVNAKGKVTAKKATDETVYITITTKDGSGVSVDIPVEVN